MLLAMTSLHDNFPLPSPKIEWIQERVRLERQHTTGSGFFDLSLDPYKVYISSNNIHVVKKSPINKHEIASTNKMLIEIKNLFGLNLSQLATIIGVSRPQLYKWIDGEGSPKNSQVNQKIAVFYHFAQSAPAGDTAFFGRFANKYVSPDMRVIDVLSSNDTSEEELSRVYGSIANDIKLLKEIIND